MEERILDILFEHYSANSGYTPVEGWEALNALLQNIPFAEQDKIIKAVCSLCANYEKQGFTAGIKAGFRLAQELNIP